MIKLNIFLTRLIINLYILSVYYCNKSNNENSQSNIISQLQKETVLFACTIIGKNAQENKKLKKAINKNIKELMIYENNNYTQVYNILNLIIIKNCITNLPLNKAKIIINSNYTIENKDFNYLDINKSINIYEDYINKNLLVEELTVLNNRLINLNTEFNRLRKESENLNNYNKSCDKESQRIKDNVNRKKEEYIKYKEKYKEGIQLRDPKDSSKLITVVPIDNNNNDNNDDNYKINSYNDPHDYDISNKININNNYNNNKNYISLDYTIYNIYLKKIKLLVLNVVNYLLLYYPEYTISLTLIAVFYLILLVNKLTTKRNTTKIKDKIN